jgi:hypothetical protein
VDETPNWASKIKTCSALNIKVGCLKTCTNWTIKAFVTQKGQTRMLMKIPSCTRVETMNYYDEGQGEDLIDQAVLAEDIQYIFKHDVEKLLLNSNSQI